MPLTHGVAIVTEAEVAEITQERGLERLDEGDATLANACKWATSTIIRKLKAKRGVQPERVANPDDLKEAAAFFAAARALASLGDEESTKKSESLEAKAVEVLDEYQFESVDGGSDGNMAARGLPRALHVDRARVFNRPTDNVHPCDPGQSSGYLQK